MSSTFKAVKTSIRVGRIQISQHAVQELESDGLQLDEVLTATAQGEVIEDYPDDRRGPSCLVLVSLTRDIWVHTVWGCDPGSGIAVLITAYKPNPERWDEDFRTRRR